MISMINTKETLNYYIEQDIKRYSHRLKKGHSLKEKIYNWYYTRYDNLIVFIRTLRYLEYYENKSKVNNYLSLYYLIMYYITLFKFKRRSIKLGFTICKNGIKEGLFITHYGSIVINNRVKIGKGCTLNVGVNIGENKGAVPSIGDNCYIGPGAKIFGDIVIGDNVDIGANSVVNKSFPDNVVIAGIPAKIIRNK